MNEIRRNFLQLIIIALVLFTIQYNGADAKQSKLPEGIKLCKKDDPELNKCLENLVEQLRPTLMKGIPEAGVPPLEPLFIPEVVILKASKGQPTHAVAKGLKITGISNYKLHYIKANVENLEIAVSVTFPSLEYEGNYDVNMNFLNLPIKGKGPMKGNATDVTSKAVLKGKMLEKDGEKYVEFTSADVDVTLKDYYIRVDKLFPDRQLNDALNIMMNDKKLQSIQTAKPIVNKLASQMLLDFINNIAKNFSFDEVFAH